MTNRNETEAANIIAQYYCLELLRNVFHPRRLSITMQYLILLMGHYEKTC